MQMALSKGQEYNSHFWQSPEAHEVILEHSKVKQKTQVSGVLTEHLAVHTTLPATPPNPESPGFLLEHS